MKLRNLVPDIRNPQKLSSAIEGIVGAITGRGAKPPAQPQADENDQVQPAPPVTSEPAPQAEPEAPDPAKQIEDALRKLLGGSKKKEQAPADK
jgi:hypothetical protein